MKDKKIKDDEKVTEVISSVNLNNEYVESVQPSKNIWGIKKYGATESELKKEIEHKKVESQVKNMFNIDTEKKYTVFKSENINNRDLSTGREAERDFLLNQINPQPINNNPQPINNNQQYVLQGAEFERNQIFDMMSIYQEQPKDKYKSSLKNKYY